MTTITLRVIKSFEYRTVKNYVIRNVDLDTLTCQDLLDQVKNQVATNGAFRPYRTVQLDALKIYWYPHMTKTQNLSINLDNPEWLVTDMSTPLKDLNLVNESELSVFNLEMYKDYEANPLQKWE